jgi:hypothetical protein
MVLHLHAEIFPVRDAYPTNEILWNILSLQTFGASAIDHLEAPYSACGIEMEKHDTKTGKRRRHPIHSRMNRGETIVPATYFIAI